MRYNRHAARSCSIQITISLDSATSLRSAQNDVRGKA